MVKKQRTRILKYLFLVVVVIVALELLLLILAKDLGEVRLEKQQEQKFFFSNENATFVKMKLPAVDAEGMGVSTLLTVEAVQGTGKTLVDIENLLFWADTQHSIRMARLVANNFTNVSIDNYDLVYNVEANASVIGGPSAGAAITIATIFALGGKKPREDVMITGTVNHDGSIGPVSTILEKAKASKETGATLLLVPLLQSRDVIYETRKHCQKFGPMEMCTQETIPKKIDVSKEAGIEVVEVSSIGEALKYFN
jgi:uncharacterized protein